MASYITDAFLSALDEDQQRNEPWSPANVLTDEARINAKLEAMRELEAFERDLKNMRSPEFETPQRQNMLSSPVQTAARGDQIMDAVRSLGRMMGAMNPQQQAVQAARAMFGNVPLEQAREFDRAVMEAQAQQARQAELAVAIQAMNQNIDEFTAAQLAAEIAADEEASQAAMEAGRESALATPAFSAPFSEESLTADAFAKAHDPLGAERFAEPAMPAEDEEPAPMSTPFGIAMGTLGQNVDVNPLSGQFGPMSQHQSVALGEEDPFGEDPFSNAQPAFGEPAAPVSNVASFSSPALGQAAAQAQVNQAMAANELDQMQSQEEAERSSMQGLLGGLFGEDPAPAPAPAAVAMGPAVDEEAELGQAVQSGPSRTGSFGMDMQAQQQAANLANLSAMTAEDEDPAAVAEPAPSMISLEPAFDAPFTQFAEPLSLSPEEEAEIAAAIAAQEQAASPFGSVPPGTAFGSANPALSQSFMDNLSYISQMPEVGQHRETFGVPSYSLTPVESLMGFNNAAALVSAIDDLGPFGQANNPMGGIASYDTQNIGNIMSGLPSMEAVFGEQEPSEPALGANVAAQSLTAASLGANPFGDSPFSEAQLGIDPLSDPVSSLTGDLGFSGADMSLSGDMGTGEESDESDTDVGIGLGGIGLSGVSDAGVGDVGADVSDPSDAGADAGADAGTSGSDASGGIGDPAGGMGDLSGSDSTDPASGVFRKGGRVKPKSKKKSRGLAATRD